MCRVYQVPGVRLQVRAGYVVRINCFPPRAAKHAARMLSRFQPFPPSIKIILVHNLF